MAKISTYPVVSPQPSDIVIGTDGSDSNNTKNFSISGILSLASPAATLVLEAASFAAQEPASLDIPIQVEFGPAQGTVSDPVMLSATGVITFNQTGLYLLTGFGNFERQGPSGGNTVTAFIPLIDGVQAAQTKAVELDKTGIMIPYEQTTPINITTAGTVLTYEIMRDASGIDAGGLYPHNINGPWTDVPSAEVRIFKIGV